MPTHVFIANRGEIAVRIARTCNRLGIASTASSGDFLDVEAQVAQAVAAGADAVHPGYGFLSENPAFARAVTAAGLAWVGPPPEAMEAMARKDHAREIAVAAGVPVVPQGDSGSFPVLVKAAAGGGGKGMRIVRSADELDEAVASAKREALSAFGDDTILIERFVEHGRHIEVQVMADTHGTVLHLWERDCSTQRRHQKVLEEAPAPTISDDVRRLVTSSAVALARQVGYTNAGTVEFLLDADTDEAFFLEMNTRLQVEHPVTEAITGLDLVELQLLVAAGEALPITQDDVTVTGHAIEARVYAEDSFGGFLPQAGRASLVRWPDTVRVDQALESDQVVSTSYDPMLGKVIAHGPDRESARLALVDALDDTAILGLTTNAGFLRVLVASDEFRDATIDTAWLDHATITPPTDDVPRAMAAWISAMIAAFDAGHPFQADGFRIAAPAAPILVELDRVVSVDRVAGTVDDVPFRQVSAENHVLEAVVNGERVRAVVNVQPHEVEVAHHGQRFSFTPPDVMAPRGPVAGDGTLLAPMPGTVLDVRVAEGDLVEEGQVLGVVEAMKMELSLKAPFAGRVTIVGSAAGRQVQLGDTLFVVEKSE
jgi:3-methylcrotonyl-CoA carboxylase alpha subunit/acetyl-CoA/propionyl-CoA carboxylase biotin carboxyl carrier protein